MNQLKKEPHSNQDDRLADFTDQMLEGRPDQAASNPDEELLSLEKTVLRLNKAIPPVTLSDATIKQMHVRLNTRIRRESREINQPFWKRWLDWNWRYNQSRPQLIMAVAMLALIVIFVVISPSLSPAGSSTTATAFTSSHSLVVGVAAVGVILILLWITRRK